MTNLWLDVYHVPTQKRICRKLVKRFNQDGIAILFIRLYMPTMPMMIPLLSFAQKKVSESDLQGEFIYILKTKSYKKIIKKEIKDSAKLV